MLTEDAPHLVFYGELYGPGIQDMTYGLSSTNVRVFDAYDHEHGEWLTPSELHDVCLQLGLQRVPALAVGAFHSAQDIGLFLEERAKTSLCGGELLEGGVVTSMTRRGVRGKWVTEAYRLRGK